MKQLTALLLSLTLLLLPVLGMAEMFENYNTYVDPTDSYGFAYPENWLLLSKETIQDTFVNSEELTPELRKLIQGLLPQMESMEMVMTVSPDALSNIVMVRQNAGIEITSEILEMQLEAIQTALPQSLPGLEVLQQPERIELGDNPFALMICSYTLDGDAFLSTQAYAASGTYFYTFTLTAPLDDEAAIAEATDAFELVLVGAVL